MREREGGKEGGEGKRISTEAASVLLGAGVLPLPYLLKNLHVVKLTALVDELESGK